MAYLMGTDSKLGLGQKQGHKTVLSMAYALHSHYLGGKPVWAHGNMAVTFLPCEYESMNYGDSRDG